jgi:hypothetical protein
LDAEEVEALTADREFISVAWLKRLQSASIPFAIRLRSDRRLRLGEEGPALPAKMYARGLAIGGSRVVGSRRLDGSEGASVPVRAIVRRVGSDAQPLKDRFLVLATSGLDPTSHRSDRGGVRLEPSRGREAGGDRRTAAPEGPRTPELESLLLRAGPVARHYYHAGAPTSGV